MGLLRSVQPETVIREVVRKGASILKARRVNKMRLQMGQNELDCYIITVEKLQNQAHKKPHQKCNLKNIGLIQIITLEHHVKNQFIVGISI